VTTARIKFLLNSTLYGTGIGCLTYFATHFIPWKGDQSILVCLHTRAISAVTTRLELPEGMIQNLLGVAFYLAGYVAFSVFGAALGFVVGSCRATPPETNAADSEQEAARESFRNVGLSLPDRSAPVARIRAQFSWLQSFGQYVLMGLLSSVGIFMFSLALLGPAPLNLAPLLGSAVVGYAVYASTKNDYGWVELEGTTLRARHLYTRQLVERSIADIAELQTILFPVQSPGHVIAAMWLGRVRAILIRFRDGRTTLQIVRADPAMTNALELMEAVVARMKELGPIKREMINVDGIPLVRRIYWRNERAHSRT